VISNEFSQRACNAQPQYGIRGNDIDCLFAPIDIETAKTIFDESVAKLQDSFDKDGLCIYRCPTMDPDCEQESDQEGTCAEDGFCVQSCSDPDCDKCNLKDQYIECTYEMLCGEASVNSQHAGEPTPCEPQADYLGNPEECPGDCVDGCEYHNRVENCMTGACDDMNCPLPDSEGYEGMVPPCMDQTEIEFTAGEYTGREGDPNVPLDTCYGVGTEYKWSLIAEVTCLDKKYEKPIFEARFGTLPLRARIHQYFQQRYHEPFVNECTYSQECVIGPGGGGAGAGEPNTGNTGGGGGSSNPPPGLPNS